MANKVDEYLAKPGNSMASLAAKVGVEPSTITRPLKGQRDPSMGLARDIERVTDGEITALDFIGACVAAQAGQAA